MYLSFFLPKKGSVLVREKKTPSGVPGVALKKR